MASKKTMIILIAFSICFAMVSAGCAVKKLNTSGANTHSSSSSVSSRNKSSQPIISSSNDDISQNSQIINYYSSQTTQSSSISSSSSATDFGYRIENLDFISKQVGYLCLSITDENASGNGYDQLFKTANGGKTWVVTGKSNQLDSTSFIDEITGYGLILAADGVSHTLVKTMDRGLSWSAVAFFNNDNIGSIDIVNSSVIFVSTSGNVNGSQVNHLYKSIDGGAEWAEINLPKDDNETLIDINWISSEQGYALYGGEGFTGNQTKTFYFTNNSGTTWSIKSKSNDPFSSEGSVQVGQLTTSGYLGKIQAFSNGIVYITLDREGLIKSADGGVHFDQLKIDQNNYQETEKTWFINSSEGYAAMDDGNLYYTTDGALNWTQVTSNAYWSSLLAK